MAAGQALEEVVAENIKAIMKFKDLESAPEASVYAKKQGRVSISYQQMNRILKGRQSITLDTLSRLARGFGYEPYQLLIPKLDPGNPQILRLLSTREAELYTTMSKLFRESQRKP